MDKYIKSTVIIQYFDLCPVQFWQKSAATPLHVGYIFCVNNSGSTALKVRVAWSREFAKSGSVNNEESARKNNFPMNSLRKNHEHGNGH